VTAPDTEQLVVCRDRASGLVGVIAIDDTTLGPALGGIRMRSYASEQAAVAECRRLGRIMTLKNALADIDFGGGKAVILESEADREARLRAFGRFVEATGGTYVPAVDMGMSVADLRLVAADRGFPYADVDPSRATAVGVHAAISAAVRAADIAGSLHGLTVVVHGVGSVGAQLARLLAADGARLVVADIDAKRAELVARDVSGVTVSPESAISTPCDVFAPCSVARVIDDDSVGKLRARVVAGAANDVLQRPELAAELAARAVTYVPDFVANAGGVIQVRAVQDDWSPSRLQAALLEIGRRAGDLIDEARRTGAPPQLLAEQLAYAKLGREVPTAA
jgi:leucine dehydrogenase